MKILENEKLYALFEDYYKNYIEEMKRLDKITRQARMTALYIERKECCGLGAVKANFLILLLKKSGYFWDDFKKVWDGFKPREYAGGCPNYHSGDGYRDS